MGVIATRVVNVGTASVVKNVPNWPSVFRVNSSLKKKILTAGTSRRRKTLAGAMGVAPTSAVVAARSINSALS